MWLYLVYSINQPWSSAFNRFQPLLLPYILDMIVINSHLTTRPIVPCCLVLTIFNEGQGVCAILVNLPLDPRCMSVRLRNHDRSRSWNQPVLINEGKVSCSRKQREPLMGFEPTTDIFRIRRVTHCATPPLIFLRTCFFFGNLAICSTMKSPYVYFLLQLCISLLLFPFLLFRDG